VPSEEIERDFKCSLACGMEMSVKGNGGGGVLGSNLMLKGK
jgi:hypothetical protein